MTLDLLDEKAVCDVLRDVRPTHLVHTAWRAVSGDVLQSPENVTWVRASIALMQAFHESGGFRAAVVGSSAEYDWTDGICRNGRTPLRPATVYGACKHALNVALQAQASATGLGFVWPRVFFLYGPHEHETRLVASVVRSLVRGDTAACTNGLQVRDYMHVDDAAAGVVAALESDHQGAIDIASGTGIAVRELVIGIARAMGREDLLRFGALPRSPHEVPLVVGDATEAASELGWKPLVSMEDGIADAIASGRRRFASSPVPFASPSLGDDARV